MLRFNLPIKTKPLVLPTPVTSCIKACTCLFNQNPKLENITTDYHGRSRIQRKPYG